MSMKTIANERFVGKDVPWDVAKPLIAARLKNQVRILPSGCWEFTGYIGHLGYGEITVQSIGWRAHRLAYSVFKGPIPKGMHVCHTCDHRPCLNPDHLWLGTHLDNQRDALAKGKNFRASKTNCPHGHEYAIHGVMRNGGRACRICEREKYYRQPKYKPGGPVCRRGHPYTPESTYINPDGRRRCKICQYAAQAKRAYKVEEMRP